MSNVRNLAEAGNIASGGMVPETIQKLGIYMQALRDVPEQPGFPHNINWPVEYSGS